MADKMDWKFPGHASKEIYDRLVERLAEVAKHYSLKLDNDPVGMKGRVHRPGADVKFHVDGEELHVNLDFAFIVPHALRQRVKDELSQRVSTLFA